MVKRVLLVFLLSLSSLYAETYTLETNASIEVEHSNTELLSQKIEALLGKNAYARHVKFIHIIFADTPE